MILDEIFYTSTPHNCFLFLTESTPISPAGAIGTEGDIVSGPFLLLALSTQLN